MNTILLFGDISSWPLPALLAIIALLVVTLGKGADLLVEQAVGLASRWNVPTADTPDRCHRYQPGDDAARSRRLHHGGHMRRAGYRFGQSRGIRNLQYWTDSWISGHIIALAAETADRRPAGLVSVRRRLSLDRILHYDLFLAGCFYQRGDIASIHGVYFSLASDSVPVDDDPLDKTR